MACAPVTRSDRPEWRFFGRIAADSIAAQVGARETMEAEVEAFAAALKKASRAADNTVTSYRRDLLAFRSFMLERAAIARQAQPMKSNVTGITADHIRGYLAELMKTRKTRHRAAQADPRSRHFSATARRRLARQAPRGRFARQKTKGGCRRSCSRTKFAG